MTGIYKITSPSNKIYVGQTTNFKKRIYSYKILNCKNQRWLYHSFMKYGFDMHTVEMVHLLPVDVNQETLNAYEQFYFDQFMEANFILLNIKQPGHNGKHSEESKRIIGEKSKQKFINDPTLGKRINQFVNWKLVKRSDEHKRAIANHMTGKQIWLGRKHTEETKGKISKKHNKAVLQYKDGLLIKEFDSLTIAAEGLNISRSQIGGVCRGRYGFKTAGGFIWKFKTAI